MKNNGSGEEEVTKKFDTKPFVSHLDRMLQLEACLIRADKLADQAGEVLKECREHIALAMQAFEAMKE